MFTKKIKLVDVVQWTNSCTTNCVFFFIAKKKVYLFLLRKLTVYLLPYEGQTGNKIISLTKLCASPANKNYMTADDGLELEKG